jgi:hypothetical protein
MDCEMLTPYETIHLHVQMDCEMLTPYEASHQDHNATGNASTILNLQTLTQTFFKETSGR